MQFHETTTQTCTTTTDTNCCSRCKPAIPHDHDHDHDEHEHHHGLGDSSVMEMLKSWHFITFCIGAVLFISAVLMDESNPLMFWTYLISFFLVGGEILYMAVTNLFKGHLFDENFLMGLATVGAFSIGEYPEGVAVMLFFRIGEFFQDLAVDRSRKSITKLMDIRPDFANLQSENGEQKVSPNEVTLGSHIIVRPGEKIPLMASS